MDAPFRLQVKFMGVRGSTPTPVYENLGYGGNTACLEVRSPDDHVLVIDCGSGLRNLGVCLMKEFKDRDLTIHALITHFHWDHIQGLPFFAPLFSERSSVNFQSGCPADKLQENLQGQMLAPYFPVSFDRFAARRSFGQIGKGGTRVGSIAIRRFPLNHPQGAWGYRLESNGASIVHASDLEHGDPKLDSVLRHHAQNADVLVYDAQYTPEQYESKKGWGHSTWLEATRVASEARVKTLVLFHHDPSHDDATMTRLVEDARRHFENTHAAKEGWAIRV